MLSDGSPEATSEVKWVGPVLTACALGRTIAEVILLQNPSGVLIDRGAYLRVQVPQRCHLKTAAVEAMTGVEFTLPGALEAVMPSFQGRLSWSDGEVSWT